MTPEQLQELRRTTVVDLWPTACCALGIRRTLGYRLARERGELVEGVRVLRIGSRFRVPSRQILIALGYGED